MHFLSSTSPVTFSVHALIMSCLDIVHSVFRSESSVIAGSYLSPALRSITGIYSMLKANLHSVNSWADKKEESIFGGCPRSSCSFWNLYLKCPLFFTFTVP